MFIIIRIINKHAITKVMIIDTPTFSKKDFIAGVITTAVLLATPKICNASERIWVGSISNWAI